MNSHDQRDFEKEVSFAEEPKKGRAYFRLSIDVSKHFYVIERKDLPIACYMVTVRTARSRSITHFLGSVLHVANRRSQQDVVKSTVSTKVLRDWMAVAESDVK